MARVLIACYRRQDVNDPEIYAAMLAKTFACYPETIGWRAVDAVTKTSPHPPTRADVVKAADLEIERSAAPPPPWWWSETEGRKRRIRDAQRFMIDHQRWPVVRAINACGSWERFVEIEDENELGPDAPEPEYCSPEQLERIRQSIVEAVAVPEKVKELERPTRPLQDVAAEAAKLKPIERA